MLEKLILGFSLAIPIGPISLAMIKTGLQRGFLPAIMVRLGGITGHFILLFHSYYVLTAFPTMLVYILALIGSLFLIAIAIKGLYTKVSIEQSYKVSQAGFGQGFLLAFANPISVIFWIGVFANTIVHTKTGFFLNLFILLGVLIWGIVLAIILQVGKEILHTNKIQWIVKFSNIIMLCYGLYYTYKSLLYLFT